MKLKFYKMNINPINEDEQWKLLIFSLNEIRIKKSISCLRISELSGIAPNHVSRFFSCKYKPTLQTFLKIAKSVNINICLKNTVDKTDFNLVTQSAAKKKSK